VARPQSRSAVTSTGLRCPVKIWSKASKLLRRRPGGLGHRRTSRRRPPAPTTIVAAAAAPVLLLAVGLLFGFAVRTIGLDALLGFFGVVPTRC
jgi:hypothetical protein